MVKYMKGENDKITGIIWENGGSNTAVIAVGCAVILAVGVTALAWWKTNQPQMKLNRRLSTCHTCGGK